MLWQAWHELLLVSTVACHSTLPCSAPLRPALTDRVACALCTHHCAHSRQGFRQVNHLRLRPRFSSEVESALERAAAECPSLEPLRLQDEYDAREREWGREIRARVVRGAGEPNDADQS